MQEPARFVRQRIAGRRGIRNNDVVKFQTFHGIHVGHVNAGREAEIAIVNQPHAGDLIAKSEEALSGLRRPQNDADGGIGLALGQVAQRIDQKEIGLRLVRESKTSNGQTLAAL